MRILMVIAVLTGAWSEETLIVNTSVALSSIDEDSFKEVYLGKKTAWDDGSRVVVVVLKEGPTQDHLLMKLNKSSSQFLTGWKKLVFTGKGTMPEMVDSVEALVSTVAKTPGAIGYVDKDKIKDGVKAITLK
jgi:ABC-type phosphate transport system substrate-binding protein